MCLTKLVPEAKTQCAASSLPVTWSLMRRSSCGCLGCALTSSVSPACSGKVAARRSSTRFHTDKRQRVVFVPGKVGGAQSAICPGGARVTDISAKT